MLMMDRCNWHLVLKKLSQIEARTKMMECAKGNKIISNSK